MKFYIDRVSTETGWGTKQQPHPKAVREEYPIGYGNPKVPNFIASNFIAWVIDLSAEELVQLGQQLGMLLELDTSTWTAHENRKPYPYLRVIDASTE